MFTSFIEMTIFVTGFGAFGGHETNPTTEIIEALSANNDDSIVYDVLEVSTVAVDKYVTERHERANLSLTDNHSNVSIHLGVDGSRDTFNLETCCYNNKDFRIPDVAGYQPLKEPIDDAKPLDHANTSSFNLERICSVLRQEGFSVNCSTNPGRYLCNYIYYKSFSQQEQRNSEEKAIMKIPTKHRADAGLSDAWSENKTIFIHVPTFNKIEKAVQVAFIKRCIELLTKSTATSTVEETPLSSNSESAYSCFAKEGSSIMTLFGLPQFFATQCGTKEKLETKDKNRKSSDEKERLLSPVKAGDVTPVKDMKDVTLVFNSSEKCMADPLDSSLIETQHVACLSPDDVAKVGKTL